MLFIFDTFFWPLEKALARVFKPMTAKLDALEDTYQDFCKTHKID